MSRAVVAAAYGGVDVLEIVDVDPGEPGPGEARVAIRAAGVNPIDAKARAGYLGTDPATLPRRLGFEGAGVVTAVGPAAEGSPQVQVGDEVIVFRAEGVYATDVVVPTSQLTPKPAGLGWPEAAGLLLAGVTAVHSLVAADVSEGDTVLIHGGSGGVGLLRIQLARLRGARVIATASERNHDLIRQHGAEPVAYGEGLLERVRAAAPDGVDAALDYVGTDEALDVSLALVEPARIATIVASDRAFGARIKVLGGRPGADRGEEVRAAARATLVELAGRGDLTVLISATYPLDDVAAAHEQIDSGHTAGKIALLV